MPDSRVPTGLCWAFDAGATHGAFFRFVVMGGGGCYGLFLLLAVSVDEIYCLAALLRAKKAEQKNVVYRP